MALSNGPLGFHNNRAQKHDAKPPSNRDRAFCGGLVEYIIHHTSCFHANRLIFFSFCICTVQSNLNFSPLRLILFAIPDEHKSLFWILAPYFTPGSSQVGWWEVARGPVRPELLSPKSSGICAPQTWQLPREGMKPPFARVRKSIFLSRNIPFFPDLYPKKAQAEEPMSFCSASETGVPPTVVITLEGGWQTPAAQTLFV